MRRYVSIVEGTVENGKFKANEDTRKSVPYMKAKSRAFNYRDIASDYIDSIGGKSEMALDHYAYYAERYGKRGGLKEVCLINNGNMTEDDFTKFIQPYGYVGAYHK